MKNYKITTDYNTLPVTVKAQLITRHKHIIGNMFMYNNYYRYDIKTHLLLGLNILLGFPNSRIYYYFIR